MKLISFISIFFSLLTPLYSQAISLKLLPERIIYEKHYADAISHQLSLSKQMENREYTGNIGGSFTFADLSVMDQTFQFSLASTVFTTLIRTPGHIQVFTADYLVDIFIDSRITGNLTGRFTAGHLSAHFSDDGVLQLKHIPVNYVRDYYGFSAQYMLEKLGGKVYSGITYNYHILPVMDKYFTFHLGGDISRNIFEDTYLYAAADIKIKSEVNYGTTQSYQAGIQFHPGTSQRAVRLAFTHVRGYEERGQFFTISREKNFLGVYLDL